MVEQLQEITALCDGVRSSTEIAKIVGLNPRHVRKSMLRHNLPRRGEGAAAGSLNHQFAGGRRIDPDGYVLVTVPSNHPHARSRTNRSTKLMYEHRYVAEQSLGRYPRPEEVVDHIDGLTLHNAPTNLEVYPTNAAHLAATLAGRQQRLSASGQRNILERFDRVGCLERIDTYRQRRASGDVRLHQILRLASTLGTDSLFLLGTSHHTSKAGIDMSSRSTIELALAELSWRWEQVLAR
jgi:hypothetical protein